MSSQSVAKWSTLVIGFLVLKGLISYASGKDYSTAMIVLTLGLAFGLTVALTMVRAGHLLVWALNVESRDNPPAAAQELVLRKAGIVTALVALFFAAHMLVSGDLSLGVFTIAAAIFGYLAGYSRSFL